MVANLGDLARELLRGTECFTWNIDEGEGKGQRRQLTGYRSTIPMPGSKPGWRASRTRTGAGGLPKRGRSDLVGGAGPVSMKQGGGRYGPRVPVATAIIAEGVVAGCRKVSYPETQRADRLSGQQTHHSFERLRFAGSTESVRGLLVFRDGRFRQGAVRGQGSQRRYASLKTHGRRGTADWQSWRAWRLYSPIIGMYYAHYSRLGFWRQHIAKRRLCVPSQSGRQK